MKKFLALCLCLVTILVPLNTTAFAEEPLPQTIPANSMDGIWEGNLPAFSDKGTYFNDSVTINIKSDDNVPVRLKVNSMNEVPVYVAPKAYQMYNGILNFELYDDSWYSVAQLRMTDENTMQGTYSQKNHKMPIEFKRVSYTPLSGENLRTEFLFDGQDESYWLNELKSYRSYSDTDLVIPYTYALCQWDKNVQLINMFHLDTVIANKNDIEIMEALLQLVNDNFDHDGSAAITGRTDPLSIIALHNEKGGIECRGLSILLSELLRLCNIEAKPIMCISSKEPAECHVVVHAYSPSLNQWIMLDPTFNLMLKDKDGRFMDLPSLREALINGEEIHANDAANYNGAPFYMPRYREYMTKNTFRFASAQNFYFGASIFPKTDVKGEKDGDTAFLFGEDAAKAAQSVIDVNNPIYMLVPKSYKVPYINSRQEIVTTDAEAFWALPERSKEIEEALRLKAEAEAEAKKVPAENKK